MGIREAWCWDTEYEDRPGEHLRPVVLVAQNVFTGEQRISWLADGSRPTNLPFNTSSESVAISFYAAAENRCALAMGVPLPTNNICLFAEHRAATNGLALPMGNGLVGALAYRGLSHIDAGAKKAEQEFAAQTRVFDDEGRNRTTGYCCSDVASTIELFWTLAPSMHFGHAMLRGRYMKAVAAIESNGVPIDTMQLDALVFKWDQIAPKLIAHVDRDYGIYEGATLKHDKFSLYLRHRNRPWPRTERGRLALDIDTLDRQASIWPDLKPLYQLRRILNVRLPDLPVGHDGRCRTSLSPFRSKTSRNQPSTTRFPFGLAKDLRCLIKPPKGYGLAYIDFSAQENCIAAGLSGDERLVAAYQGGDPYLAFGKDIGMMPPDATKQSHPSERSVCKEVILGLNYGLGPQLMAEKAGISEARARELIWLHKQAYATFWKWSNAVVSAGQLKGEMSTVYGWKMRVSPEDRPTSLMNFPMQANGAEMMRLAAIAATEAGIEVCAPVHDAFLIAAPLERLDEDIARMSEIMTVAGEKVTGGVRIRTDAKSFRYPNRYVDERGAEMWNFMVNLAGYPEAAV
ncbi:hypothetical protein HY68_38940 [Streptomyces sp. AcH 505]|nr:hypothetical protein HY68_38940 [Streptomyces sp. AcH 505]